MSGWSKTKGISMAWAALRGLPLKLPCQAVADPRGGAVDPPGAPQGPAPGVGGEKERGFVFVGADEEGHLRGGRRGVRMERVAREVCSVDHRGEQHGGPRSRAAN